VSISKAIHDLTERLTARHAVAEGGAEYRAGGRKAALPRGELERVIADMEKQMRTFAKDLEFEKAAALRDQILEMKTMLAEEMNLPGWKKAKILAGEE
jgi:excinuclease ABC subunit B